jgi:hypothetical protein
MEDLMFFVPNRFATRTTHLCVSKLTDHVSNMRAMGKDKYLLETLVMMLLCQSQ